MDTKLLITAIRARFNHNAAKAYLKDKYDSSLIFAEQNGLWKATPELIGFLQSTSDPTVILVDNYGNPLRLDRESMLAKTKKVYDTVMNEWLAEWEDMGKNR